MTENELIAYAITAWVLVQLARVFLGTSPTGRSTARTT